MNKDEFREKYKKYKQQKADTGKKLSKCGLNCSEQKFNKMHKELMKGRKQKINKCKKCKYADLKNMQCLRPKYIFDFDGIDLQDLHPKIMDVNKLGIGICYGKDFERI